jgi:DNA-binding CsgD family transcriptional regulator
MADPRRIPATRYYRRFMKPLGWRYSAHLLFWQQNGVETSLALRRRADQGDFTGEEMEAMQAVHPHLAVALARVQVFEWESERRRLLESFYRFKPEAVLFLNWNLDVLYASHEAMVLCADWNLGATHARAYAPQAVFSPPPELLAVCETLKFEWGRRQAVSPDQKTALTLPARSERHGGEAAITLQCADRGAEGRPVFVIRLRPVQGGPDGKCTAVERQRLLGLLSPGERELAELVSVGLSNKEVATRVNKTVGSVKVQLSGVFQKLRVNSRTQLALRLSVGSDSCP